MSDERNPSLPRDFWEKYEKQKAALAERIARSQTGENRWRHTDVLMRGIIINGWRERIETIRDAGLELVEREGDGW